MSTVSGQNLAEWRRQAREAAIAAKISPEEVDWLLMEVSGLDRLSLRLNCSGSSPQIALNLSLEELSVLWQRRLREKIPLQYLVGVTPWRNLSLKVSPSVLIPRPETEEIIDIAVKYAQKSLNNHLKSGIWVDLGTGSGAIALGLAQVFPQASIYGVDMSAEALKIAQENVDHLGYGQNIQLYQGNWWYPLPFLQGQVAGMVSNPPYIPTSLIPTLQKEVADFEPQLALDGGEDGLMAIRHLVKTAPLYLVSGGLWLIEMMSGQGNAVKELLENQGDYEGIEILADISGSQRFALAYRI